MLRAFPRDRRCRACLIAMAILGLAPLAPAAVLTYTTNLKFWLKADALGLSEGNSVGAWADSSTQANNASQGTGTSQPTYHSNLFNGQPGVTFDGVDDFLSLLQYGNHALNTTALTYFVVFRTSSATDQAGEFSSNPIVSDISNGIGLSFGIDGGKGQFSEYNGVSHPDLTGSTTVSDGAPHLLSLTDNTYNGNPSGTATLRLGSTIDGTMATTYAAFRSYNTIGNGYASAHTFDGDIAEILIYHATLSDADRQSVESYLNEKYLLAPEPSSACVLAGGLIAGFVVRRKRALA